MTEALDMSKPFDRLIFNYAHARRSWECWCFMVDHQTKVQRHEINDYIDNNDLLFHLRYLALKDFHIEFTKIIKESKNNGDNIFKFLKALISHENVNKNDAIKCLEQLNSCDEIMKVIIGARDKYFAHLDPDFNSYLKTFSIMDINKCFVAIENSIMTITSREALLSQLDKIPSRDELKLKM